MRKMLMSFAVLMSLAVPSVSFAEFTCWTSTSFNGNAGGGSLLILNNSSSTSCAAAEIANACSTWAECSSSDLTCYDGVTYSTGSIYGGYSYFCN